MTFLLFLKLTVHLQSVLTARAKATALEVAQEHSIDRELAEIRDSPKAIRDDAISQIGLKRYVVVSRKRFRVGFVGRSQVGKSSAVNALVGWMCFMVRAGRHTLPPSPGQFCSPDDTQCRSTITLCACRQRIVTSEFAFLRLRTIWLLRMMIRRRRSITPACCRMWFPSIATQNPKRRKSCKSWRSFSSVERSFTLAWVGC